MSATLIKWTPNEEAVLGRVQGRMQSVTTDHAVTRRELIVALLRLADHHSTFVEAAACPQCVESKFCSRHDTRGTP
jgi:hypothetical protein